MAAKPRSRRSKQAVKPPKMLIDKVPLNYKRSHSNIERLPSMSNDENALKSIEPANPDTKLSPSPVFYNPSQTKSSTPHDNSQSNTAPRTMYKESSISPRDHLSDLPKFNLKRRQTFQEKNIQKLDEKHIIKNREDFEEAVSCDFEEDIASKSLNRNNRINEGIILDNIGIISKRRSSTSVNQTSKDQYNDNADEEMAIRLNTHEHVPRIGKINKRNMSDSSSPDFDRCTSLKRMKVGNQTTLKATLGKTKKRKKMLIVKLDKNDIKNIKI